MFKFCHFILHFLKGNAPVNVFSDLYKPLFNWIKGKWWFSAIPFNLHSYHKVKFACFWNSRRYPVKAMWDQTHKFLSLELLFCREWQRNVSKCQLHVQRRCFGSLNILFCAAIIVSDWIVIVREDFLSLWCHFCWLSFWNFRKHANLMVAVQIPKVWSKKKISLYWIGKQFRQVTQ